MMILLFGPPGVGKGTQADLLSKKYNLKKFSMGDILREEVSFNSLLGSRVEEHIRLGNLVPDDIVVEIVENFLIENRNGHILFDGFPRTMNQALILERSLARLGMSVDVALEMYLSEEDIIKRLRNRRHCPNCGRIYNYITDPPKKDGVCDNCGQRLIKRIDDDEDVIKKRLEVYEEETKPITDYYKSLSVYKQIDAAISREEVFKKISGIINGRINKK